MHCQTSDDSNADDDDFEIISAHPHTQSGPSRSDPASFGRDRSDARFSGEEISGERCVGRQNASGERTPML